MNRYNPGIVESFLAAGISASASVVGVNLQFDTVQDGTRSKVCMEQLLSNASHAPMLNSGSYTGQTPIDLAQEIENVASDPKNYESGEPLEGAKAREELISLVVSAAALNGKPLPVGDISPYYGEISITWRNGDKMIRATAFADDRRTRLDYGSTPNGALGAYRFDNNASARTLTERLRWLFS